MIRNLTFGLAIVASAMAAGAVDYSSLEGLSGAALKEAVKKVARQHNVISYGDKTWDAFRTSDVRMVEGREAWFDMYSNRLVYVSTGHAGMNIEHSVANSWWGGEKNDAYKDLHHLNPSDADANNRKSDKPLGLIAGEPTWSNGVTKIGTPQVGLGGGASSVFEPADWFKGDFARAYFYVFTIYDDIKWEQAPACMYDLTTYPTLKPWAYEMLLQWAAADPVDIRESERNKAVNAVQKNENPFVAIPGLADYIWGEKKNTPFHLQEAMMEPVANRPQAPTFDSDSDYDLAGLNTWTGRWWDPFTLSLSAPEGADVFYSINGGDYRPYTTSGIEIEAAKAGGETIVVSAYSQTQLAGNPYRGETSTLTLTAYNSNTDTPDYQNGTYQRVSSLSEITEDDLYIVVSVKNHNVMGCEAKATSASAYLTAVGAVTPEDERICKLPVGAAIVKFVSDGGTEYYVSVNDVQLDHKGFLLTNEAKKVTLAEEGRAATLSFGASNAFKMDFGASYGNLLYNPQSPRFSVYTSSTQEGIDLYRYIGQGPSSVIQTISPTTDAASRIFTPQGIEISSSESELPAGLYIVVTPGRAPRKILRR